MGRGLRRKNVIFTVYIRDLSFLSTSTAARYQVYKDLIRPRSFFENELRGRFFLPPNRLKIRSLTSRIWIELSDREATPPHVTRKVVQNTRPSVSHVRGGAGHETRVYPPGGDDWHVLSWWLYDNINVQKFCIHFLSNLRAARTTLLFPDLS